MSIITPSEEISQNHSGTTQVSDSNLANDSLHLGGIPAEDYATQFYVQQFFSNVETLLKEYIDTQDATVLEQAKAYTDDAIRNIDFSDFAELKDLDALEDELMNTIEDCKNKCNTNINTKIANVVSDVNENFSDVNATINQLAADMNTLFTSVSSGKQKVAAAITDKGVSTASNATFDTMATNISKIETSKPPYDKNWVNTVDATATADDIQLGETAYVKGEKIYGTHKDLDTSDATATADDILEGATAYVDGQKITGTYEELDTSDATASASDIVLGETAYVNGEKITGSFIPLDTSDATASANDIWYGETAYVNGQKVTGTFKTYDTQYPTYGTDTSNATASASDIATGKTAYINGQYITGTGGNSEVEEIYTTSVSDWDLYEGTGVSSSWVIGFSKDLNYCVFATNYSYSSDFTIESHKVTEDGIITEASVAANNELMYKKYSYTKEELGIEDSEQIIEIALSAPGLVGRSNQCLLMIRTQNYAHFYTYHLYDNGVIGKAYQGETYVIDNIIAQFSGISGFANHTIFCNTTPYKFYNCGYWGNGSALHEGTITVVAEDGNVSLSLSTRTVCNGIDGDRTVKPKISSNDKYITNDQHAFELDEYLHFKTKYDVGSGATHILSNGDTVYFTANAYGYGGKAVFGTSSNIIKQVTLASDVWQGQYASIGKPVITPDENFLIASIGEILHFYNWQSFVNAADGDSVSPSKTINMGGISSMMVSVDGSTIRGYGGSGGLATLKGDVSTGVLTAIRYKNKTFTISAS